MRYLHTFDYIKLCIIAILPHGHKFSEVHLSKPYLSTLFVFNLTMWSLCDTTSGLHLYFFTKTQ